MPNGGSGPSEPCCTSCREPITSQERSMRINFENDPHGHRGLTGLYHEHCGKPFQSLARVVNLNWSGRF
jgi:hypothetical protein